jgi:hypothetical protein
MADALPTNLRRRSSAGACYGDNVRVFCTAGFEFRERVSRKRLADIYASKVAGWDWKFGRVAGASTFHSSDATLLSESWI